MEKCKKLCAELSILIDIPDFPGYKVSSEGQIIGPRGGVLSGGMDKDGYIIVTLRKDGKNFTKKAHRVVCSVFHVNENNLPQVNHKDGCKQNNHPDNLEWVTASENRRHAYHKGLQPKGEAHGRAKLTEDQVLYIREYLIPRHPVYGGAALARRFGVDKSQVNRVFNGVFR